jgi:hypothetical protein
MISYIKATLLLSALAMATHTIAWRGNEELGILYLILFASFKELWEIKNEPAEQLSGRSRRNSKNAKTNPRRRARKNRATK